MPQSLRPPLPVRHANPHIPVTLQSGSLPPVKYQILNCQGQDILVGRMKIETPTPTGHAFILRRFDTGAVSLTTMFRAAFPNAPEHEERSELQWVKENHDLTGNNGGPLNPGVTRLAGTWVSPALARTLGEAYALGDLITAVVEATPDPHGNYRRSGKNASAPVSSSKSAAPTAPAVAEITTPPAPRTLPTPSPTAVVPPATKRRKESSPAPPPPIPVSPPVSPAKTAPPPPRRSSRARSRTQSPGLSRTSSTGPLGSITITRGASVTKTPKVTKVSRREEVQAVTPGGSDLTVVDEETELIKESVAGSGLQQQDEAEWKESYAKIVKSEAAKKEVVRKRVREEEEEGEAREEEMEGVAEEAPTKLKRAREEEEEKLQFVFQEPQVGERAIATNKRVSKFHLQPKTKQLAWGAAAFAIGMGAAAFLPNFL
ncbi:Bouquet formation protein 4 [Hypsizygus marmoreus]|uniref:Bouquet formation protein 4 n=1 Tax=Hypsizygus marmoreus TaxID=39966 RepID=A0A369JUG0_HYPMA|nr:Bouquet formation protein 4 [Hypsizygus marmoreus]